MDISVLAGRISGGRLFHSYIITGSSADGQMAAAQYIARTAVCSGDSPAPCGLCRDCQKALKGVHPDITLVEREKDAKEIAVDVMRRVRAAASVMPNEAPRSVYIIPDADLMNTQAQNAMLKVLEDPPGHAVFLMLAENPERFLPTVRSRCETVRLSPEGASPDSAAFSSAERIFSAVRSKNELELAEALIPLEKAGKADLPELTAALRKLAVADATVSGGISPERLSAISDVLDDADKFLAVNVSAGHIAGLLLAGLLSC